MITLAVITKFGFAILAVLIVYGLISQIILRRAERDMKRERDQRLASCSACRTAQGSFAPLHPTPISRAPREIAGRVRDPGYAAGSAEARGQSAPRTPPPSSRTSAANLQPDREP